jgi:hypothetical protein
MSAIASATEIPRPAIKGLLSMAWALVVFLARRSGFVDRLDARVAVLTARRGVEAPRKAA